MDLFKGKRLGPYEVVSFLGAGGMAQVYRAYEATIDRYVAVKIVSFRDVPDPAFPQRFTQEARLIAKLRHPHIVAIYGFGEADGYAYMAMPLIEGGTLGDRMREGPLLTNDVKRYVHEIARALDYAHSEGVIHRDVKPGNVLMDTRGECLLTDFGVAKLMEGTVHLTGNRGDLFGTPVYMSPEQCEGGDLDHRTDIYSLGVITYQMLVGHVPFQADTPYAVMLKHIKDPPPSICALDPTLPDTVERVIERVLAKDRDDRYATAAEFAQDLDRALTPSRAMAVEDWSGVAARSVEMSDLHLERMMPPERSIAWGWVAIALVAGALAGLAVWALRSGSVDAWLAGGDGSPAVVAPPIVPPPTTEASSGEAEAPEPASDPEADLESELQALVRKADRQFEANQYTVPADDNAILSYRAVLELAPGDAHATGRLAAMAGFFARRAAAAEADGDAAEAARNVEKALLAAPEDAELRTRLASLRAAAERAPARTRTVAGMVAVPAGDFRMGSPNGRPDARPEHAVSLGAYAIDRTEVSVADYSACVAAGACSAPAVTESCNWQREGREQHPVNCVSWTQARAYCSWAGKRLPTEAEWERAARGSDARLYPWGDARIDLKGRVANVADVSAAGRLRGQVPGGYDDGFAETAPVGSFPDGASPVGALDMAGNVWEWVADWYDPGYYASSPRRDPPGPTSGSARVLRGGSWAVDVVEWFGATYRYRRPPGAQVFDVGFRCAR